MLVHLWHEVALYCFLQFCLFRLSVVVIVFSEGLKIFVGVLLCTGLICGQGGRQSSYAKNVHFGSIKLHH